MNRKHQTTWMMMVVALAATMVAGGAPAVAAQDGQTAQNDKGQLSSQDQQFVDMAAQTNLFEVAAARAALQKSSGNKMRDFANMIIKDHTKAQQQLTRLGQTLGVEVPAKLNKKHQKKVDAMARLRGEQFRTKYVNANVNGHEEAIKKFQHESKQGQNQRLKAWAMKIVPVLKKHLKHAKQLQSGNTTSKSRNKQTG